MDLKALQAFCIVAAHGSFTRAATAEGFAQSILSRQVFVLEEVVGGRLFHRTGRGVVPTELGERLLPRAKILLAESEAFQTEARGLSNEPRGVVDIGAVPVATRPLMGALCARLQRDYPRVRLRALEAYSGEVEDWLAAGRIDIGLFNRYRDTAVRGAEPMMRTEMLLVSAPGHPATRGREVPFKALDGLPLAGPTQPNSLLAFLSGLAARQRVQLNLVLEAGSTGIIKDAVMQSEICTIYPPQVVAGELATGELVAARIIKPSLIQRTWLAVSTRRPLSQAARLVARLAREIAHGRDTFARS